MLCSNKPWRDVVKSMKGEPFVIQDKFDGERVLIHKDGDVVRMFSRNSIECTDTYLPKLGPLVLGHGICTSVMACAHICSCAMLGHT